MRGEMVRYIEQCGDMRLYVADLKGIFVCVCVWGGGVFIERRFPCLDYRVTELMVNEWIVI
jgi:hypothetical protein